MSLINIDLIPVGMVSYISILLLIITLYQQYDFVKQNSLSTQSIKLKAKFAVFDLNVSLLSALATCNRDKAGIRRMEESQTPHQSKIIVPE
ncbi:TPA_asm: hypothetical protein G0D72_21605 [Salmonella enterica subsp. diarizonae]|uniref:Uncharacterized protein n=1 Tax=Salmonella diarizonae TaxID=59204 RepID=A0A702DHC4_SALDZ|nr:hypothetical protein [Salmonella enterica subsp. diarizonae]HAC6771611.1 hypothetical protein [Salmonella enterica subsp. diarizonae]HAF7277451.1 hypothetical protein [Salmonella enterica subsp. diarizonae serovar 11:k:z53]